MNAAYSSFSTLLGNHDGGFFRLPGRGVEMPHPIASGSRLEGRDCQGWRLRHRHGAATRGSALDRPALEGYMIGSE